MDILDDDERYDLHMHSRYSDGSDSVRELIAAARERGLAGIAVTDHDSTAHLAAVRAVACEEGYPVLAGTEVSAFDPATGRKVHILAYGVEAAPGADGPLDRLTAATLTARTANTLWQVWMLRRMGASFGGRGLSADAVLEVAREGTGVYKQHVMEALTGLPYTSDAYRELYPRLFKGESPANRDIAYPNATDAVRAVCEQGGVPVLAHAGQTDSWGLIPDLVRAGLAGIEVHHPDHGPREEALASDAAATYGLFKTGGSDYHGRYGGSPHVGFRTASRAEAAPLFANV